MKAAINQEETRIMQIHKVNLRIAEAISTLSRAERKKVGCIIVDNYGRLVSSGYNGTPSKVSNSCEIDNVTKPEVIHAEINAVLNSTQADLSGCIVYLTLSPCVHCAAVLLQKRISEIYYSSVYRNTDSLDFLKANGVKCNFIQIEENA